MAKPRLENLAEPEIQKNKKVAEPLQPAMPID